MAVGRVDEQVNSACLSVGLKYKSDRREGEPYFQGFEELGEAQLREGFPCALVGFIVCWIPGTKPIQAITVSIPGYKVSRVRAGQMMDCDPVTVMEMPSVEQIAEWLRKGLEILKVEIG